MSPANLYLNLGPLISNRGHTTRLSPLGTSFEQFDGYIKLCAYHDRLWTFPIFVDIVGRIQVNNLRMCKSSIPCMDFCNFNEG